MPDARGQLLDQMIDRLLDLERRLAALETSEYIANAGAVDGYHAGNGANQVLLLDGSGLVPLADIPATLAGKDADTVDGYHAATSGADAHVIATDVSGNATISGGLNVGTATGAPANTVRVAGATGSTIGVTQVGPGNYDASLNLATDDSNLYVAAYDDGYTSVTEYAGKAGIQSGDVLFLSAATAEGIIEFYTGGRTAAKKHMVLSAAGNVTIAGTLTVNGNQTGATDHVFDDYDDIALLKKWREGDSLPFEVGDMLNRDRLLRDTILQVEARVAKLEEKAA